MSARRRAIQAVWACAIAFPACGQLPFDKSDPQPHYTYRAVPGENGCQKSVARVFAYSRKPEEHKALVDVTQQLGLCLKVVGVVISTFPEVQPYVAHMPNETYAQRHARANARKQVSQWLSFRSVLTAIEAEVPAGEAALLLETDARLTLGGFDEMLGALLRQLRKRVGDDAWDILFVGSCMDRGPRFSSWYGISPGGDPAYFVTPYLVRSKTPFCTHAMAINGGSARRIQDLFRPSIMHRSAAGSMYSGGYDTLLAELIDQGKIRSYTAWPPLAVQNGCGFKFDGLYVPPFKPKAGNSSWCDRAREADIAYKIRDKMIARTAATTASTGRSRLAKQMFHV